MDRYLCKGCSALVAAGVLGFGASASHAAIIDSASFFQSIPHTLIDFETDGLGNPLSLIDGQSAVMPAAEYAAAGVTFVSAVRWVNDASPAFDAAQAIGGSPDHAIPSAFVGNFAFTFSVPVRAFGMWVINNDGADPAGPSFLAYDANNVLIESVQFQGALIDGNVNDGNTVATYGYMGIHADRDIARVEVRKVAATFDDLRFSAVPAPGVAGLAGIAGLLGLRRRR
jgi:hypothetical protein